MDRFEKETAEFLPVKRGQQLPVTKSIVDANVEIGALSHPGKVKPNNEDHFSVVRRRRSSELLACSLPPEEFPPTEDYAYLMTVADGMGGKAYGEVASETALRAIHTVQNRVTNWIMRSEDATREELEERVKLYAEAIQEEFLKQAQLRPELDGMATTLASAYAFGTEALIVNIGDSRVYLIRNEQITQITHDHNKAQEMKDQGALSAVARPYRNIVTRYFGATSKSVALDVFHMRLYGNDRILLCTDGLTDMIDKEKVLEIVNQSPSPKEASDQLVAAALAAGGRDNITVVLARFPTPYGF